MRNLPPQVVVAIQRDDVYALKLMGRRGGQTTQRRRDIMKAVAAAHKERTALELYQRAKAANEDVVPVDDTTAGSAFFHEEN